MPAPARFFEVLRDANALPIIFPEMHALFGVPQPEQWHPEIDTGVHTLMVLEQAAKLSDDPVVRFAALTHDLGKGTTPPSEWPRHIAHEQRGVALVEGNVRSPADSERAIASSRVLVSRYHLDAHRVTELRDSDAARAAGTSRCLPRVPRASSSSCSRAKRTRAGARGWRIATIRKRITCVERARPAAKVTLDAGGARRIWTGRKIAEKLRSKASAAPALDVTASQLGP